MELIKQIQHDDKSNPIFRGEWEGKILSDAPIIAQFEATWKTLAQTYESEMPKLLWGKLPHSSAIDLLFKRITKLLLENDL